MDDKMKEAIQLLRDNDYIVKKFTKSMKKDADDCEASSLSKRLL